MSVAINITIIILFLVYIFWTWNNTKCFEGNIIRISYILIGTLFITLLTYIIFLISKNGMKYPNEDIAKELRNIILRVFIPINGFITLPRIANIIGKIKNDEIDGEKLKKKIIIFSIVNIIVIIFECIYFKNIQNGILQIINSK